MAGAGLFALFALAMGIAWRDACKTGLHGRIDGIWALSTGIGGALSALLAAGGGWRGAVLACLSLGWGIRLGGHLLVRNRGADDPRYAMLMRDWGDAAPRRLFRFLQAQAAVGWLLALCIGLAARATPPLIQDCAALALFLIALSGESLADVQLRRFRLHNGPGKVCDEGLWRYSRHPNYFFEWLVWCAVALAALDFTGHDYVSAFVLLAPLTMYLVLVHGSGIPPLEAHMLRTRGVDFAQYQRRVRAFWPWPFR